MGFFIALLWLLGSAMTLAPSVPEDRMVGILMLAVAVFACLCKATNKRRR